MHSLNAQFMQFFMMSQSMKFTFKSNCAKLCDYRSNSLKADFLQYDRASQPCTCSNVHANIMALFIHTIDREL